MTVADILDENGIDLDSASPGQYATTCPRCSAKRKPQHRKFKVLGIKIDERGVCWRCNHCGWSGPEKGKANGGAGGFAATYDYRDANGTVQFQKVRYPPGHKSPFSMRRPDGKGGWINNLKGVDTKLLCRIDEVNEAIALGHTIAVVEGEKDVDNLWRIGIPATCNAHGAHDPTTTEKPKWYLEHSQQLRGAPIVVFNDNDAAGYAHADATCRLSVGIAKRVRRLDLKPHWPDIPKGGDVSDWLHAGHTREELDALIAKAKDYKPAEPIKKERQARSFTAKELDAMDFEPLKYVVPGVIVEGLTLFAGKPKIGKSWFLLHAGIAVARGGFTLGEIHCQEGDVKYYALEDNPRRMQSRMRKLMGMSEKPERLSFQCDLPRLIDGGLDEIKAWIETAKHPRLVMIDTLAMVRGPRKQEQTQYEADYAAVLELRKLANEHSLAIIVVHHTRKAEADDAFDTISGTLGLAGCPDTIMLIKRDAAGATLHARGRDLPEISKAVSFNKNACTWTVLGDAEIVHRSQQRTKITGAIATAGEALGAKEIAAATNMKEGNVRNMLRYMEGDGEIKRVERGRYTLSPTH